MTGMLTEPQLDPFGAIIAEARADADLATLVSNRVRAGEPAPKLITNGVTTYEGDARGPGEYIPFVVISTLDLPIHPQLPITFAEYAINCYGTTFQNATAVWLAFVKAFHKVRSRTKASGLGIYSSTITAGGSQDRDPDTKQPVIRGVLRVIATASSVTPPGS